MTTVNRRKFLATLGATSAVTIVPRRVLGGRGYVPPSDMVLLAQVGCGTQSQRQVNCGLVERPDLQFIAVVDPNRDTQNYVDWDRWGNRDRIRTFLGDPDWGSSQHRHPRWTRRRARDHGDLLPEARSALEGHPILRGLPRDVREGARHPGHRQHHSRSSARLHQHRGAQEEQGGHLAQASRQRTARGAAGAAGAPKTARRRHICSRTAIGRTGTRSRRGSTLA